MALIRLLFPAAAAIALLASAPAAMGALELVRIDSLDRVFPDRFPEPAAYDHPLSVPRGGSVAFQFAVRSDQTADCRPSVSPIQRADGTALDASVNTYELIPVHVEANNNGGSRTSVTSVPPPEWQAAFIRKAPFDLAEVLVEAERLTLNEGTTHALLVDVHVADDAEPGRYRGELELRASRDVLRSPFELRVHSTLAPPAPLLDVTFWFWPEPENLTNGDRSDWWSERHWELLENSGRVLRAFGQNSILTPLINHREPLIRTIRRADGAYDFDYTRFDRWVETFRRLGFEYFNGQHIWMLPVERDFGGVFVLDGKTGDKQPLMPNGRDQEAWLTFIPTFYRSLQAHLDEKGWTEHYIQHQLDEPKDGELYQRLAALAREHMPRVRTMDAINSQPQVYSPLVDIQVFALTILAKEQALADERRAKGQGVWMYHCCSPYPPYPNRHLDERLSASRLYPSLAYLLKAQGYLNWAANIYRGADPYKTSIGPVPGGSQDPGHPPGDNWFYYPGPDGLRASLRQVAFRDGLLDHALLCMLTEKDQAAADRIMESLARSLTDYETEPASYHRARKALLRALDAAVDGR